MRRLIIAALLAGAAMTGIPGAQAFCVQAPPGRVTTGTCQCMERLDQADECQIEYGIDNPLVDQLLCDLAVPGGPIEC